MRHVVCEYKMTIYSYLLNKKQSGELSILFQVGLPTNILTQMDIYAFHLQHPTLSQWKVALHFGTHKYIVWIAYRTMSQPVT